QTLTPISRPSVQASRSLVGIVPVAEVHDVLRINGDHWRSVAVIARRRLPGHRCRRPLRSPRPKPRQIPAPNCGGGDLRPPGDADLAHWQQVQGEFELIDNLALFATVTN